MIFGVFGIGCTNYNIFNSITIVSLRQEVYLILSIGNVGVSQRRDSIFTLDVSVRTFSGFNLRCNSDNNEGNSWNASTLPDDII